MRLLCDVMLERLARWLRAAGHDVAMAAPNAADAQLLQAAREEGRRILTRDRDLARAAGELGLLIEADGPEAEAVELGRKLALDWRLAPFTRCVMDNTPLRPASPEEVAAMPDKARTLGGPFNACPLCGRLYWPGSHVKRMAARLERFSQSQQTGA